jgi:hypothetical protein
MPEPAEGTAADRQAERERQRNELLKEHKVARAKRDGAALGGKEYEAAMEDIARIEVAINRLDEPETETAP